MNGAPELARCFDIGPEIVVYEDERDCAEKIRWVLGAPEEAAMIRAAGRHRAPRDHTWDTRFAEVFRLLGMLACQEGQDAPPR